MIELLIALVVLAVLSMLAMPAFSTWVANNHVRAVAEDMAGGLRLAQTEALRRSRQTVFVLTAASHPAGGNYTAAAGTDGSGGGSNWAVSIAPSRAEPAGAFVRGGAVADIGSGVAVSAVGGFLAVCFSPQGRLAGGALPTGVGSAACPDLPASPPRLIYTVRSASSAGDHPLQIEVGLGGQVRLCNPAYAQGTSGGAREGCQSPHPLSS